MMVKYLSKFNIKEKFISGTYSGMYFTVTVAMATQGRGTRSAFGMTVCLKLEIVEDVFQNGNIASL